MIEIKKIKMHRGKTTIHYEATNEFGVTPVKYGPSEIPPGEDFQQALRALRSTAARWAEVSLSGETTVMPYQVDLTWDGGEFRCKLHMMRTLKNATSPLNQPTPTKFTPAYEGAPERDMMDVEDAGKIRTLVDAALHLVRTLPEREPTLFDNVDEAVLEG